MTQTTPRTYVSFTTGDDLTYQGTMIGPEPSFSFDSVDDHFSFDGFEQGVKKSTGCLSTCRQKNQPVAYYVDCDPNDLVIREVEDFDETMSMASGGYSVYEHTENGVKRGAAREDVYHRSYVSTLTPTRTASAVHSPRKSAPVRGNTSQSTVNSSMVQASMVPSSMVQVPSTKHNGSRRQTTRASRSIRTEQAVSPASTTKSLMPSRKVKSKSVPARGRFGWCCTPKRRMSASAQSGEETPVRLSVQPEPSSDYPATYPQQSGLDRPGALYSSRLEANSYREREAQYSTVAGSGVHTGIPTGATMYTSGVTAVSGAQSQRVLEHGHVSPLARTSISSLPTTMLATDAVAKVTEHAHVSVPAAAYASRSTSHASALQTTQRTMLQHASAVLSDMTTADAAKRVTYQDSKHITDAVSSHQTKETRTQGLPKELIADAQASLERLDRVTETTEGSSTIRSKSAPPRSFEGFQLGSDGVYEKITYIDKERVEEKITRRPVKTVEERVRYINKEEADVEVEIEEKINYVAVKQVVERPKEVIRHVPVEQVVEVEQIVEVPGELVEREKPYLVEEQVIVPRYIDQEVHTVVSQRMQPVIVEASEEDNCYLDVKCRVYNMQTEAVDIFVPLPVQRVLFASAKYEEHREIPRHLLPPEHYNGLVRDLNAHLPLEDTLALFLMDKSMAHLLVNKQFINLEEVGAIPCTSGPGTEFVPVPEGVNVLPCTAAPTHPSLATKIYSGAYPTKDDWLQASQMHIQQMEEVRANNKAVQGAEHSYGPYNYAFQPHGMFNPTKGGPFHVHHHLAPEKPKEETSSSATTQVQQQVEVVRSRQNQRPTKIRGSKERRKGRRLRAPPSTSFESESFSPSQSTSSTICSPNLMPRSRHTKQRRSSTSSAPRRRQRRRTSVEPRKKAYAAQRTGKSTSTLVEDAMSFIEGHRK